jgi:cytochrome P450
MMQWIFEAIPDRRQSPRDDLVSKLVEVRRPDGSDIPDMSVATVLVTFITGGQETTAKLLMNCMWILLQRPDIESELRADQSLISSFVEETLRHQSPVQGMFRVTLSDVVLGGVGIPAGSLVQLMYGAANRDPAFFPDADTFDLHREGRNHFAFAQGAHFCPGASLARLELKIAFEQLLKRFKKLELAGPRSPSDVTFFRSHILRGVRELWIDFQ